MVAINPEMLRELLDEFTEKEEVTREEMNAINQQIAELEKRIESSKIKLAGLNKDREKINLMRERYLSGNWKLQLSNMAVSAAAASSAPDSSAPVSSSVSAAAPTESTAPAPSSHAEGRAARRAARESSSPATAGEPTESSRPEPVAQPVPVNVPAAEVSLEPIPEPILAPEPVTAVLPETEPEVIIEPVPSVSEALATDAPTFSSVAQFEANQAEASQAEAPIEHAPPDDPIMSSFSSASTNAPDINSALASGSQSQEAAAVEPENSGFSWSSTAINAVPAAADNPSSNSSPSPSPNPWGSGDSSPAQVEVEQRQSAADIWGHPAASQQAAPAPQQPAGAWGDFGEDWQMKEAEAQRAASVNASASAPESLAAPPPTNEGGWGQTGGGSPWSSPAAQSAPAEMPAAGGGWGQPTASRQGMPAMQAPTNFPLAAPPAASPRPADSGDSAAEAWGRSGQASSSGWATQGSPWGDPAAQAQPPAPPVPQTPANPFSQPQPSPSFAQPAQLPGVPMSAPEQTASSDESRSSLARAADGALISPVKGRRRGAGTPAAFDWGSPDSSSSGNAGDPNQQGGPDDSGDNKKIDDVLKGLFK